MMRAMEKKLNEEEMQSVANGVMDGVHVGAIIAVIVYCLAQIVKYALGFDLTAWLEEGSWSDFLTLVFFLATAVAYWVFCDISRDWRKRIDRRLEFEMVIANGVHLYKENRAQLISEAFWKAERELRPERHLRRERRFYKMMRCSVILLLVASALALSASGLLVLKLALTVLVFVVAAFVSKCGNRIIYGRW